MNSVYIEKGRPLFKGIKNLGPFNVNRTYRAKLFWLSKSAVNASIYGTVGLYRPRRKLRLLKLTYGTIRKLYESPNTSENLKTLIAYTWGAPNNTYLNQYLKMRPEAWRAFYNRYRHLTEQYNPNTGMTHSKALQNVNKVWKNNKGNPIRAGRISILNFNVKMYGLLRNKFMDKYDGIWAPAVRSPYHGPNKFPSELVIFKPDEVLDKEPYSNENLQANYARERSKRNNISRKVWYRRRGGRPPAIEGAGSRIYARPRKVNSQNVIRQKRGERWNKLYFGTALNGPGKAFFKNNNSIVNIGSLFKNNNRRN